MDSPLPSKRACLRSAANTVVQRSPSVLVSQSNRKFEQTFTIRTKSEAEKPIKVSFTLGEDPQMVASRTLAQNGQPEQQCYLQPTVEFISTVAKYFSAPTLFHKALQTAATDVDPFKNVPLEVWNKIFTLLPLIDRVRCRRVSKRLAELCHDAWKVVESLNTTGCPAKFSGDKASTEILGRIRSSLRVLKLSGDLKLKWLKDIRKIGRQCPKLESLTFPPSGRSNTRLWNLSNFAALKVLRLEMPSKDRFAAVQLSGFLSLPKSIEVITGIEIRFNYNAIESDKQFERFFSDRPSLKEIRLGELHFQGVDVQPLAIFRIVAEHCPLLKKLSLAKITRFSHLYSSDGIELLTGMTEISVGCKPVADDVMIAVCDANPALEVLSASNGSLFCSLSASGGSAIAGLKNLRELVRRDAGVSSENGWMNDMLRELIVNSGASLQRLELTRLPFQDATIKALADSSPQLRELKFAVSPASATPAMIRHLIDRIVGSASWNAERDRLMIAVTVVAANLEKLKMFKQLDALRRANLPSGVELSIMY